MTSEQDGWRISRQIVEVQATAEADLLRLIGNPRTRRADIPPTARKLRKEFDRVHDDSLTVKSLDEVTEAVKQVAQSEQDFHRIDDPKASYYSARTQYAQGLHASLIRATMKGSADLVTDRNASISIAENKPVIIELLEDVRADAVLVKAGLKWAHIGTEKNPHLLSYLEGLAAGWEWTLGLREDLGIDALVETDSLPQPLGTHIAGSLPLAEREEIFREERRIFGI